MRRAAVATQQLMKACSFLDAGPPEVEASNPFEVVLAKFGLHCFSSQLTDTQLRFQDSVKSEITGLAFAVLALGDSMENKVRL